MEDFRHHIVDDGSGQPHVAYRFSQRLVLDMPLREVIEMLQIGADVTLHVEGKKFKLVLVKADTNG